MNEKLYCFASLVLLSSAPVIDAFIPNQLISAQSKLDLNIDNDGRLTRLFSTSDHLFSQSVYDTIQQGKIAVVPEFLSHSEVDVLQRDAKQLYADGNFVNDALASYGKSGSFDPSKDRAVLKLKQWKDSGLGNYELRSGPFASRIRDLRGDLAYNLNRPRLNQGDAISKYGDGSTEISYTRFGPGAFLKRHVDEHHEELKGVAGWTKPTRRSLSWLIYLNDIDWKPDRDGGFLRCYERLAYPPSHTVGARPNGDLQIGWLRPVLSDPVERPVFLDSQYSSVSGKNCALYIDTGNSESEKIYISKSFDAHPTLFIAGGELLTQKFLINQKNLASRFHVIEPPKSRISDLMNEWNKGKTREDEHIKDVPPLGGTLVMFDAVSLPHEVLATVGRERWAASGWMHEDQQSIESHPAYRNSV